MNPSNRHIVFFKHAVAFLHAPGIFYKGVQLLFYHSYTTWARHLRFPSPQPPNTVATALSVGLLMLMGVCGFFVYGGSLFQLLFLDSISTRWDGDHPDHVFNILFLLCIGSASIQWVVDCLWQKNMYGLPMVGKSFDAALWLFPASWTAVHIFQGAAVFVAWAEVERLESMRDTAPSIKERRQAASKLRRLQRGGDRNMERVVRRVFRNHTCLNISWLCWFFGARKMFYSFPALCLLCVYSWRQANQMRRIHWFAGVLYMPCLMWVSYAVYVHFELIRLNEFK